MMRKNAGLASCLRCEVLLMTIYVTNQIAVGAFVLYITIATVLKVHSGRQMAWKVHDWPMGDPLKETWALVVWTKLWQNTGLHINRLSRVCVENNGSRRILGPYCLVVIYFLPCYAEDKICLRVSKSTTSLLRGSFRIFRVQRDKLERKHLVWVLKSLARVCQPDCNLIHVETIWSDSGVICTR